MAMSRWPRSRPMATANRFKAASTRQKVCQWGHRAGKARGVDSTDEFILSTDKRAAHFRYRHYSIGRENFQNLMNCFSACHLVATDSVSDGLNWTRLSARQFVPQKER